MECLHLSWSNYGCTNLQEPLQRKVIEEGVYSKSLKVEVYPWHLKICENSKLDDQISKQFSRSDTIGMCLLTLIVKRYIELLCFSFVLKKELNKF